MELFLKAHKTFVTKAHVLILDYDIKYSIYDTVSRIVTEAPEVLPAEGDIAIVDGRDFIGIVKSYSIEDDAMTLDINQIQTLFSRDMLFTAESYTYLEDYAAGILTDNFSDCPDAVYALPWLTVEAGTHTAVRCTPDIDDYVFNPRSYLSKIRRLQNIYASYDYSRTGLTVTLSLKPIQLKSIDFSNPNYYVVEETYSDKRIGRITSYCEENGQTKDWYLLSDGTLTNTYQATGRMTGEWKPLVVSKADDVEDKVKDEFAKSAFAHKISFMAPLSSDWSLYDQLRIRLSDKIFRSYVTGIEKKKDETMMLVSCGELQTEYPYIDLL